jgi:hypothetical protein
MGRHVRVRLALAIATVFCGITLSSLDGRAEEDARCTPVDVAVFSNRVHVRCSAAVMMPDLPLDAIAFFAFPTSDAPAAERVLSTLLSAQVANRQLWIRFNLTEHSDAARNIGCQWHDCRLILAVGFGPK